MQQHGEPEDLALLALGETVDRQCSEHVATCAECGQQLAELREVVTVGKASGGPDALVEPPEDLWRRIESQLDTEPAPITTPAPTDSAVEHEPAPVIPIDKKRGLPRWVGLVAATAAGILIGGAVVTVVTGQDSKLDRRVGATDADAGRPRPRWRGECDPEPHRRRLLRHGHGNRARGPEGFYEVWLLDPAGLGLVALGSLAPGEKQATFPGARRHRLERLQRRGHLRRTAGRRPHPLHRHRSARNAGDLRSEPYTYESVSYGVGNLRTRREFHLGQRHREQYTRSPEPSVAARVAVSAIIVIPSTALVAAIPVAWNHWISWLDVVLAVVLYLITAGGITVGYHRYFTHGSFKAKPWVAGALGVAGLVGPGRIDLLLGGRASQAPCKLRRGRRPALPLAVRHRAVGGHQGLRVGAHRLAGRPGADRRTTAGPRTCSTDPSPPG